MTTTNLNYFFSAATIGDIFILDKCLNSGVDIHSCNDLALRLAVKGNHSKAIVFLLAHGANIQAIYDDSLRHASLEGNFKIVKALLETKSCSQEAKIYSMYNAIFAKHIDIINLLLDNGVSPTENNGAVLRVVKLCKDRKITALFKKYLN